MLDFFLPPSPFAHHHHHHHHLLQSRLLLAFKSYFLWDITPCIPLEVNGRFGKNMSSPSPELNKPNKKSV
jgi:hypothetical protein